MSTTPTAVGPNQASGPASVPRLQAQLTGHPEAAGPLHTLEAGIEHARQWIAYWEARRRPGG